MNHKHIHLAASALVLITGAALITLSTRHLSPHLARGSGAAGAVIAAAHNPSPAPAITPTPTPIPAAAVKPTAAASGQALGVQTAAQPSSLGIAAGSGLAVLSSAELAIRLDQMRTLGVTWLRYDVEWANIEQKGTGLYDWSAYDRVTAAATTRGFAIIGIIDYTPPWARLSGCAGTSACAPNNPADYGAFAGAAARHYSKLGIHHWEIWNEPNNRHFFQPGADTARYTAMLRSAYSQIKAADPGATVLTGGLSPADTGGGYISPIDFINALYQQGAAGAFDAVADHPYSFPFLVTRTNPDSAWGQMKDIRATMVAHGDAGKKIWVTEYGAPTGGPGNGPVSEAIQAQILADVIAQMRTYTWAGPLLWYSYKDVGTTQDTVENFFGLVRADGTPKPAYQIFKNLASGY